MQHKHPIVRWGLADLFPVKRPPAAGEQLVAVFGPAVGQQEVLGELYLQRRGLFVGFVGHEQVYACVFRGTHTLTLSPFGSRRCCSMWEPTRYSPAWMVNRGCMLCLLVFHGGG